MALLLSVAIDRARSAWPAGLSGFSIACANAVIDALESAEVAGQSVEPIRIKWPNDLVRLRGRGSAPPAPGWGGGGASNFTNQDFWLEKVAGILIETRQTVDQSRIVIGLGLNLCRPLQSVARAPCVGGVLQGQADLAPAFTEPERVETLPGGLLGDTARDSVDAQVLIELAHRIAQCLPRAWLDFAHSGLASFRTGIERRDVLRGEWVEIEDDIQGHRAVTQGCVVGIDDRGQLLVSPFSRFLPPALAAMQGSSAGPSTPRMVADASQTGAVPDACIPVPGADFCLDGLMRYCGASVRLLRRKPGLVTLPGARG
jgi:biotin-(acetyl-CoA carboxylase) ligase